MANTYIPPYSPVRQILHLKIKDFVKMCNVDIELQPVEQRLDVQRSKNESKKSGLETKRQGIVNSIFDGLDHGELHAYNLTDDEIDTNKEVYGFDSVCRMAIHEGGHRARAIYAYVNGEFPTTARCGLKAAKYYRELTVSEREYFDTYPLRLVIYDKSTPEFRAKQFALAGKSTPLNEQEILNGYGNIPIANAIRNMARTLGSTMCNTPHQLFSVTNKNGKVVGDYLKSGPDRMTYDRFVARMYEIVKAGERPAPCDNGELENMYNDARLTDEVVAVFTKKVTLCADVILRIAKCFKNQTKTKLSMDDALLLVRNYYSYLSEGIKIADYEQYTSAFIDARAKFHKGGSKYANEILSNGHPRWQDFWKSLRNHKDVKTWNNSVTWFQHEMPSLNDMINDKILKYTGGPRAFSLADKQRKWVEQGKCCAVEGLPLAFDEAAAGHNIAFAKGGSTTYENLVVIHKKHNTAMGTMSLEEYKAALEITKNKQLESVT